MGYFRPALAVAIGLSAWVALAADVAPKARKVLQVHLPEDIVTLDWNQSVHEVDLPLILNLQEGLTVLDKNLKSQPGVAESWKYDSTGTQLKFKLRASARWSDGRPVTSRDFVETFHRILSPKNSFSTAYFLFPIVGAEDYANSKITDFGNVGIKAPADDTLEITFRDPSWRWVECTAVPALFPIRADIVQSTQNWAVPGVVSNGPFTYVSHTIGKNFLLRSRDDFPGRNSNIDEINLQVSDFEGAIEGFENGKIDVIFRLPRHFRSAKGLKGAVIYENRMNRTRKLDVNKTRYPTSNPEFRRALAAAIDRPEMLRRVKVPYVPATALVPEGFPGHYKGGGVAFSEKLAKRSLGVAGATTSTKIDLLVPLFDDSKDEDRDVALELKRQWETRLKVRVEITFATTVAQYLLLRDAEAYHFLLRDFNVDSGDPLNFYSAYAEGARFKMKWPDRRFAVMLQEAGRAKSDKERNQAIVGLDDYLLKDTVSVIPLYYRGDLTVVRSNIRGYDNMSWQPYYLKNLSFKP